MKIPDPPHSQSQVESASHGDTFEEQIAAADRAQELPPMDPKAFHGIMGRVAQKIGDHSEADPRGVLPVLLVGVGNVLGRAVYSHVNDTTHYCNEFASLVGLTARARKGLSTDISEKVIGFVDDAWKRNCIARGFSSGEGLIALVADEVVKSKKKKDEDGKIVFESEVVREGAPDKRKLCIIPELGELLTHMTRDGNSLSHVLREAWDSRDALEINTRTNPLRATEPHISIIGNITKKELLKLLPMIPNADGFANRFLWFLVRRLKNLPEGGPKAEKYLAKEITEIREAVQFARALGEVHRSEAAKKTWAKIYEELNEALRDAPGVVDRAEAHRLRFSIMYAILDHRAEMNAEHVEAAHALCSYSEACTMQIFGVNELCREEMLILDFLQAVEDERATRTLIQNRVFHNHKTGAEITAWLRTLHNKGLAQYTSSKNQNGNEIEQWYAVKHSRNGATAPKNSKKTKKARTI
jgi:hypothetical protein